MPVRERRMKLRGKDSPRPSAWVEREQEASNQLAAFFLWIFAMVYRFTWEKLTEEERDMNRKKAREILAKAESEVAKAESALATATVEGEPDAAKLAKLKRDVTSARANLSAVQATFKSLGVKL